MSFESYFGYLYNKFTSLKASYSLGSPGSYDNLHKEMKNTLAQNFLNEGAKFDIASMVSGNLAMVHSFTWGNSVNPPSYHFSTNYADAKYLASAQIDHNGGIMGRGHYNWIALPVPQHNPEGSTESLPPTKPEITSTSKVQAQYSTSGMAQNVLVLEHEHVDKDFSISIKATNPNPFSAPKPRSFTGVPEGYSIAFLQSISKSFALGGEYAFPRSGDESSMSYALRYAPEPSVVSPPPCLPPGTPSPYAPVYPKDPTEVFTTTFSPSSGLLHASYWRRLNQRLEVGSELQMLIGLEDKGRREGIAVVGFKLDTLFATVRGQLDSHGRIATVLEERIAQGVALQLCAEMDYGKGQGGQGKIGIGFSMEM